MARRLERFSGSTILCVDDTVTNLQLLEALLAEEGISRVFCESDPRRVEALLPEIHPDLVLLDLVMPHLDGLAILEQIERYAGGAYLPVLVLTADVTTAARDRALAHGARDFLVKPLDITEAVLRIANLLETRELYTTRRPETLAALSPAETEANASARAVLRDQRLSPVYQPVVDVETLEVVGYEALSRFLDAHPQGPAGWFRDASRAGVGVELEWLALTLALPALDALPQDVFLAVNMSPAAMLHIRDRQVCDASTRARVVVELTEHVPVEDYRAVRAAFADMHEDGARLAADDLGSGYAGFRHLLLLEPDIIKLDISLVSGLHENPGARALTKALAAFAADIGATVIAEGVEEAADLVVLQDLQVPWAQGFLLGRPAPLPNGSPGSAAEG
jgi:EAL domain-containing protein (putative c-di-GMP-specific phosphodiesterase class I)/ActR/RegA family two-component response regulator